MGYLRESINFSVHLVGKIRRNRKVCPPKDVRDGLVKINLGCGLRVAKGWINIDGSLNAMFATWPNWMHKILYRLSGARQYYSLENYCDILTSHQFLHHDLALSLPLFDSTVDFIYSSHFFEHLFKDDAALLLKACANALKDGGIIRISVPDLAYAISLYSAGQKIEMLEDYFFVSSKGSYLARHKYMYDFDLLKTVMGKITFLNKRGF